MLGSLLNSCGLRPLLDMISCSHCREKLSEFLDNALDPAAREAVASHLKSCAACAQIAHELESHRAVLLQFAPVAAPESLRRNVRLALQNEAKARQTRSNFGWKPNQFAWSGALTLAAMTLIILARPSNVSFSPEGELSSPSAESAPPTLNEDRSEKAPGQSLESQNAAPKTSQSQPKAPQSKTAAPSAPSPKTSARAPQSAKPPRINTRENTGALTENSAQGSAAFSPENTERAAKMESIRPAPAPSRPFQNPTFSVPLNDKPNAKTRDNEPNSAAPTEVAPPPVAVPAKPQQMVKPPARAGNAREKTRESPAPAAAPKDDVGGKNAGRANLGDTTQPVLGQNPSNKSAFESAPDRDENLTINPVSSRVPQFTFGLKSVPAVPRTNSVSEASPQAFSNRQPMPARSAPSELGPSKSVPAPAVADSNVAGGSRSVRARSSGRGADGEVSNDPIRNFGSPMTSTAPPKTSAAQAETASGGLLPPGVTARRFNLQIEGAREIKNAQIRLELPADVRLLWPVSNIIWRGDFVAGKAVAVEFSLSAGRGGEKISVVLEQKSGSAQSKTPQQALESKTLTLPASSG